MLPCTQMRQSALFFDHELMIPCCTRRSIFLDSVAPCYCAYQAECQQSFRKSRALGLHKSWEWQREGHSVRDRSPKSRGILLQSDDDVLCNVTESLPFLKSDWPRSHGESWGRDTNQLQIYHETARCVPRPTFNSGRARACSRCKHQFS